MRKFLAVAFGCYAPFLIVLFALFGGYIKWIGESHGAEGFLAVGVFFAMPWVTFWAYYIGVKDGSGGWRDRSGDAALLKYWMQKVEEEKGANQDGKL